MHRFSKYHGCLNDFLLTEEPVSPRQAIALCDRHGGIGADGVAVVSLSPPGMTIFNPDGSKPEMCGNALRCVVKHLAPRLGPPPWTFATDAGPLQAWLAGDDVVIDMGAPRQPVREKTVDGVQGWTTSMGNPHFVVESTDPKTQAECSGRTLSVHPTFSEGCNISFVEWVSDTHVKAFVYERGAGLTMACGTGACAIATVGWHLGKLKKGAEVTVQLPGGSLGIVVSPDKPGHLLMRGPAVRIFDGEMNDWPASSS